ncbi:MAG: PfkB family carbohydrate kinase [Acidimicrobiia bacterium]
MTTVTCVGLAVQDFVFSLPERLIEGEKNFAGGLASSGGGPAATAAVAASRLGADARLVSVVGSDLVGDAVIAELEAHGVGCTGVRRVDAPTSMSAVLVAADGERTIINRTDPFLWSQAATPTVEDLAASDVVLVDVRWPEGAMAAIDVAGRLGIPTVVDCDATDEPVSEDLLAGADTIIFAESAMGPHGLKPNAKGVQTAAARWDAVAAVTKGSEGVIWSDGTNGGAMPAFSVAAIDTLGAGDVFHGAFAAATALAYARADAFEFASAAAAIRCARGQGRDGIPTRNEVEAFLEANK